MYVTSRKTIDFKFFNCENEFLRRFFFVAGKTNKQRHGWQGLYVTLKSRFLLQNLPDINIINNNKPSREREMKNGCCLGISFKVNFDCNCVGALM